jgi:hypothetical protein
MIHWMCSPYKNSVCWLIGTMLPRIAWLEPLKVYLSLWVVRGMWGRWWGDTTESWSCPPGQLIFQRLFPYSQKFSRNSLKTLLPNVITSHHCKPREQGHKHIENACAQSNVLPLNNGQCLCYEQSHLCSNLQNCARQWFCFSQSCLNLLNHAVQSFAFCSIVLKLA